MKKNYDITIKRSDELDVLRQAGKILAGIVAELKSSLKIGMTTKAIDEIAEELMLDASVVPAFKGYRGFPGCVCTSINHQVVHGIPSGYVLKDGDILSLDAGIIYKQYYSDTAFTAGIGSISQDKKDLLEVTYRSLLKGIEQAKAGQHLSDISHAIQTYVEEHNMSVVREFVGHGIGRKLHEDPEIPNFGPPHMGPVLKEGMVLAIEPMVNLGSWHTRIMEDGWTVITQDGKPSAHFEHTIAITRNGPEILTE